MTNPFPITTLTLSATQVQEAIQSWLNAEILKTPVIIKDFIFQGYGVSTNVMVTLMDARQPGKEPEA